MPKYSVIGDEWYPVFQLNRFKEEDEDSKEFTDEEIRGIREVEMRFHYWQRKIAERFGQLEYYTEHCLIYEED